MDLGGWSANPVVFHADASWEEFAELLRTFLAIDEGGATHLAFEDVPAACHGDDGPLIGLKSANHCTSYPGIEFHCEHPSSPPCHSKASRRPSRTGTLLPRHQKAIKAGSVVHFVSAVHSRECLQAIKAKIFLINAQPTSTRNSQCQPVLGSGARAVPRFEIPRGLKPQEVP